MNKEAATAGARKTQKLIYILQVHVIVSQERREAILLKFVSI
jgi:hypothetical protein